MEEKPSLCPSLCLYRTAAVKGRGKGKGKLEGRPEWR